MHRSHFLFSFAGVLEVLQRLHELAIQLVMLVRQGLLLVSERLVELFEGSGALRLLADLILKAVKLTLLVLELLRQLLFQTFEHGTGLVLA